MFRSRTFLGVIGASFCYNYSEEASPIKALCERKREKHSGFNYDWDHRNGIYESDPNTPVKGVVHQIVLIRHGQYMYKENGDERQVLTDLGRKQASCTGTRLTELIQSGIVHPIDRVYYSTMSRATETWQLIRQPLQSANVLPEGEHLIQPCSMIREGAVCKPNPPANGWEVTEEEFTKDNLRVSSLFCCFMQLILV